MLSAEASRSRGALCPRPSPSAAFAKGLRCSDKRSRSRRNAASRCNLSLPWLLGSHCDGAFFPRNRARALQTSAWALTRSAPYKPLQGGRCLSSLSQEAGLLCRLHGRRDQPSLSRSARESIAARRAGWDRRPHLLRAPSSGRDRHFAVRVRNFSVLHILLHPSSLQRHLPAPQQARSDSALKEGAWGWAGRSQFPFRKPPGTEAKPACSLPGLQAPDSPALRGKARL